MTEATTPGDSTLSPAQAERVDQLCDEFEDACKAGRQPLIEDFLVGAAERERHALLPELIGLDVIYRRRRKEVPTIEEYQARFPDLNPQRFGRLFTHRALAPATGSSLLPRFRVLRELARGGLGVVFVARDEELQREVALKEIQEARADQPESRARFLLEGQLTGGLEHPGIVPIYGLGQYVDGRPFYAMRLIQGQSLKQALERLHRPGPGEGTPDDSVLTLRELLGRFVAVCNAIAYAHSHGILHRDLKPDNVMLGPYGETLVVDWGLAKVIGGGEAIPRTDETVPSPSLSDLPLTRSGMQPGTPAYLSPEQAEGRADQLSPATDVYGLGATLYSLLTGRAPCLAGSVAEILALVRRSAFPRPRQVKPGVSRSLEAICLKAMALRPEDRYPTARVLADDVERWLADEPVSAYREPALARFGRWVRKNRSRVGLLAALGGLTLTVAIAWQLLSALQVETQRALLAAEEKRLRDLAAEQDRHLRSRHVLTMRLASQAWHQNQTSSALELLETSNPTPLQASDYRGFEWYHLWRQCNKDRLTLRGHHAPIRCLAFSPDGKTLASATGQGESPHAVKLWDVVTGKERTALGEHPEDVYALAFSRNGKVLTSASGDGSVKQWSSGDARPNVLESRFPIDKPPRAQVVLQAVAVQSFLTPLSDAVLPHAATGLTVANTLFPLASARVTAVALSADGQTLAWGTQAGLVRIWDLGARTEREVFLVHSDLVLALAFAPDGRTLVSGSMDQVKLWDVENRQVIRSLDVGVAGPALAFAPDGKSLLVGDVHESNGAHVLWLYSLATGVRQELGQHAGQIHGVSCSPDGNTVASVGKDGQVKTWDVTTRRAKEVFPGHRGMVTAAAFSPDGKILASGSWDRTIKLWDLAEPDFDGFLGLQSAHFALALSRDNKTLALGNGNEVVRVDALDGKVLDTLAGCRREVLSVALAPDVQALASASWDRTLLWDLSQPARNPRELDNRVIHQLAFSPEGKFLALGGRESEQRKDRPVLTLWNLPEKKRRSLPIDEAAGAVLSVAFSPAGRRLASGTEKGKLVVWDVETGSLDFSLPLGNQGAIWSVAYSSDGNVLAAACGDSTVRLVDVEAKKETGVLKVRRDHLFTLAFSPQGNTLAVGSQDGFLTFWDFVERKEGAAFDVRGGPLTALRFSSDGKTLVTRNLGGHLRTRRAATALDVLQRCERDARQAPADPEVQLALAQACWNAQRDRDLPRTQRRELLGKGRDVLRRLQEKNQLPEKEKPWLAEFERVLQSFSFPER